MGEAGFAPGQMFGGRYRIVGLLGRGGMGEVFRAEDLRIGQQVALKFLHRKFAQDTILLNRFTSEVRLARQISHPNVCRVYDLGESDGHHYLAMEYVDGEDLATLLKRIGRFPPDKAVEIAHQLCAGLAAAHERGVLHRDLKPANVMIDGRGRARIMDFGLALPVEQDAAKGQVAGTPAYMAPEQLSGGAVSIQSDLYSLGLILYEVFTGKRAVKAQTYADRLRTTMATPEPLSKHTPVEDSVERAVLRCLEHDAKARPASALAVAAALPGGDPLAAALAAGETPSPEMVAAAGAEGTIHPGIGWACLALFVLGIVCSALPAFQKDAFRLAPMDWPPEILAQRARDILASAGHTHAPADTQYFFEADMDYTVYSREKYGYTPERNKNLREGHPSFVLLAYRESPQPLVARWVFAAASLDDPPLNISGMANVRIDSQGRLRSLEVVPPQFDPTPESSAPTDWLPLFQAGGLDLKQFKPAPPQWTPALHNDQRVAWEGVYAERPDLPVRVEAASYRGKPVSFQLIFPWTRAARMPGFEIADISWWQAATLILTFLVVPLVVGVFLARKNIRMGRGDRAGALRLAGFVFATQLLEWTFRANHTLALWELPLFIGGAGIALFFAAQVWIGYIALEPYVRRRWPEILVSWSRLLAGKWMDPLVGRDILLGAAFVSALFVMRAVLLWVASLAGASNSGISAGPDQGFAEGRLVLALLVGSLFTAPLLAMAYLFLLLLARGLLRKQWLALAAVAVIATIIGSDVPTAAGWILASIGGCLFAWILIRFGLLAIVAVMFFGRVFGAAPITTDLSVWYAPRGFVVFAALLAVAGFGFYTATRGRRMFQGSLLED